jgi:phage-related protein
LNEELKIFIKAEIADLKKNLGEAQKEVKETADEGESGFKKFGEAAKNAGKVVATGLATAGAAIVAAGGALLGLAESTKEYRTAQAKLTTAFESAGASAETAKDTYKDLYRVLGDEDKATEAAAHLAMLTTNEKELEEWTRACQGVYATFGESLPIEALTEASNETAKVGTVTGALADALNWAGVSEDAFNEKLAACSTEQERQALIRTTLNGLYDEAAAGYEENAAALLAENEAQASLTDTLAELGAIAAPLMTTLKTLAAELLTALTPFVTLIGEGLTGALNGADGAADKLAEGVGGLITTALDKVVEIAPIVIDAILSLFPVLLEQILSKLPDILQTIMTIFSNVLKALGEMLPTLIPVIIDAVIMCAETLLDNVDMLVDAGISLVLGLADGLIAALPRLIDKVPVIIEKLISAIMTNYAQLQAAGIELTLKLAVGLIKAVPQLVSQIPQIISSIVKGLAKGASNVAGVGKDLVKGLWNGIKDMAGWIKDKISGFGKGVLDNLKSFFGIKSPSRIMRDQVGKYLAEGVGVGFMDEMASVNKDIENSIDPLTKPRNFTVHGAFDALTPIMASGGINAPVNSRIQSIDNLTASIRGNDRPLILKVGEKVFAETTFKAWNNYVDQTGACPVKVW